MAISKDLITMLNHLNRPAFLVADGIITAVNDNAEKMLIEEGLQITDFILHGTDEYKSFTGEGALYLTVCFGGIRQSATVSFVDDNRLFVLNNEANEGELQALSLAAGQLSTPLSEISVILDQLTEIAPDQKAKMVKNLYRLQRIIGNMSDAVQLPRSKPRMQTHEMGAFLCEIFEKAQALLSYNDACIDYRLPETPVFAQVNEELITRAIYNIISNAVKFAPKGQAIRIQVSRQNNKLYITVTDCGSGIDHSQLGNVFQRYTRHPGLENPKYGLGMGLTLVHSVAAAHGGTVLIEQNQPAGTKITMTISLKQEISANLKSPIITPDIYGGQDQALIELSDILPYQLYMNEI